MQMKPEGRDKQVFIEKMKYMSDLNDEVVSSLRESSFHGLCCRYCPGS